MLQRFLWLINVKRLRKLTNQFIFRWGHRMSPNQRGTQLSLMSLLGSFHTFSNSKTRHVARESVYPGILVGKPLASTVVMSGSCHFKLCEHCLFLRDNDWIPPLQAFYKPFIHSFLQPTFIECLLCARPSERASFIATQCECWKNVNYL